MGSADQLLFLSPICVTVHVFTTSTSALSPNGTTSKPALPNSAASASESYWLTLHPRVAMATLRLISLLLCLFFAYSIMPILRRARRSGTPTANTATASPAATDSITARIIHAWICMLATNGRYPPTTRPLTIMGKTQTKATVANRGICR